jgi:hypothetical protein
VSNLDSNQDKTNDTGAIPTPTTSTDKPAVGDQTPPVVPTDKPVDQPAVTPDPVGKPAPEVTEVPTPEPAPTTSEPIKEEGEGTPPAA